MLNPNCEPNFPHVKYKESGQCIVLNTADNLKALLDSAGYEAKHNKMTLEPDIYKQGVFVGTPEEVRSELISLLLSTRCRKAPLMTTSAHWL